MPRIKIKRSFEFDWFRVAGNGTCCANGGPEEA
jgi:hypothetical protein